MTLSRALWYGSPGSAELRDSAPAAAQAGTALVRARWGALSRGTEALVFAGRVPASQAGRMRAPFQQGDFPFPVKYGYVSVGTVEDGPAALRGRSVFCLHPHEERYRVPADALLPLPEGVPPERAVLAANLETAVNALWDAAPRVGDRIAVVGGGLLGCLVAWLCGRLPGAQVTLVDSNPARRAVAGALGVGFAEPAGAADATGGDCDLAFHCSGSPAGAATALALAGFEATVVELSWYGDRAVPLPLGEDFHSRRLTLLSSQVGEVATARRARRSRRDRLTLALSLLTEPALDRLFSHEIRFAELPDALPGLLGPDGDALCVRIRYDD
ncbi:Threonine dehydrogenase [Tistlia consotensis]|uniref:Threonine dehydrogenase n=1 Tax=Tistlia consotensis USBA 355 TaxID=560819 RepID=A0A1Y6BMV8_9PROT|nr:zinc-binding alcohol dehydrogenase [Tistlia consotensis]SMF11920.1 Threonine dehydrogenase [Tistlia consotensis USBA 355]SNR51532.1 Threonine dehydrogenase [Tistlia consotensis]